MKIFRFKDARQEPREAYVLNVLAEVTLDKEVRSVGVFRPDVPPNGNLRDHYHEDLLEFMIFLNQARIRFGPEIFDVSPGDVVMIQPGDAHEVLAGPGGTMPIVIKLPNNPKDLKTPL